MRVVIAEDELLERKAMCKFITEHFQNLAIVGEASNGRDAVELATQMNPDIMLMDIKMPGIDGLEAIDIIRQTNHDVKFILVSAYDSFAYAKQAMQYGIKEYILKPGKKVEMIRSIRRVQAEIEQERQQTVEMKDHLLTKLMKHPVDDTTKSTFKQFFPQYHYGYFMVMQLSEDIPEQMLDQQLQIHFSHRYIRRLQDGVQHVCVMHKDMPRKDKMLKMAQQLVEQFGLDTIVGLSHPTRISQLPKAYQEAFTACYALEKGSGRAYGFFEHHDGNQDAITPLIDLMEKGQADDAVAWFQDNIQTAQLGVLDELYMQVTAIMTKRHLSMPKQRLIDLLNAHDWQDWLSVCSLQIQEYQRSQQTIEKAKQYIEHHYNEAITLEEVADNVKLSPNYFSNFFKQACGYSFIDYVTQVRLQRAKELLETQIYSLKEISGLVGYHDPNYFSRVFKKYFSESPSQFQRGIVKK